MSFNSSSISDSPLDSPNYTCSTSEDNYLMNMAFFATRILLLLPLSILILYLGLQQWRRQRSFLKMSHSDIFTYHVVALELIWILGESFYFWGSSIDSPEMILVSFSLSSFTLCGETGFHVLTCVERYLAVVHPVVYLQSKSEHGLRIRNVGVGCVWLLSCRWIGLTCFYYPSLPSIPYFCPLFFASVAISFCSISVLRVLIHPGPWHRGREKERVDQSKGRTFLTITTILGVLWLWFGALILSICLDASPQLSPRVRCLVKLWAFWLSLTSSLVLPLLYLHRAGKLPGCRQNGG